MTIEIEICGPMRLGPIHRDWPREDDRGDCPDCGGECAPECGRHPLGCLYGGPTDETAYWLIVKGCERYHGEPE